jgi:hypothetical protein
LDEALWKGSPGFTPSPKAKHQPNKEQNAWALTVGIVHKEVKSCGGQDLVAEHQPAGSKERCGSSVSRLWVTANKCTPLSAVLMLV